MLCWRTYILYRSWNDVHSEMFLQIKMIFTPGITYLDTSVNIPRSILKNWPSWNIWLVWFWSFLVNEASLASRWKRSLAKIMLLNSGLLASWYGRMGGGQKWFIRAYTLECNLGKFYQTCYTKSIDINGQQDECF